MTAPEREALAPRARSRARRRRRRALGAHERRFTWWNHGLNYSRNLGMRLDMIAADPVLAVRAGHHVDRPCRARRRTSVRSRCAPRRLRSHRAHAERADPLAHPSGCGRDRAGVGGKHSQTADERADAFDAPLLTSQRFVRGALHGLPRDLDRGTELVGHARLQHGSPRERRDRSELRSVPHDCSFRRGDLRELGVRVLADGDVRGLDGQAASARIRRIETVRRGDTARRRSA